MLGIRQKLLLGFGGILLLAVIIGLLSIRQFTGLGRSIDVIMKENFKSLLACQEMKESIEIIDSGALFILLGNESEGRRAVDTGTERFQKALDAEITNITLQGEEEKARRIEELFVKYRGALFRVADSALPIDMRREAYFSEMLPLLRKMKGLAQEILEMNRNNMNEANMAALKEAQAARSRMLLFLGVAAAVAIVFSFFVNRWVLHPIRELIYSTNEIRKGNLNLVVATRSKDEIGQLSGSFNAMAESLREMRRSDRVELARFQRATEEVFRALPIAIAVLDLGGRVEVSTGSAEKIFGLRPNMRINELPLKWLPGLVEHAMRENRAVEFSADEGYIQIFDDNRKYFFQPLAAPIRTGAGEQTGALVMFRDVTQVLKQEELERGAISTVSHELKTPLTSVRMSLHLLLGEKIGPLNEKQTDLLVAARDDSERLAGIIQGLLDINRIGAGKVMMDLKRMSSLKLVRNAVEQYEIEAKDRGLSLLPNVPGDLPDVMADPVRISIVFSNLVSNALKFTDPGGAITISGEAVADDVLFSVSDTGKGIPQEHVNRVFEMFFRVPGEEQGAGAGLGLAIVKEIIIAHGGQVGVESQPGEGSRFWFTLRRADYSPGKNAIGGGGTGAYDEFTKD